MLWTSDPEVIGQIAGQGSKFVKPVENFSFFDLYGPNMQTAVCEDWRSHRKIVAPAIGPHSNTMMWRSALEESRKLANLWIKKGPVIDHMKDHMSEISLHCVADTFFGKTLGYETTEEFPAPESRAGRLGFVEAMFTTIDKIGLIDSIPERIRGMRCISAAKEIRHSKLTHFSRSKFAYPEYKKGSQGVSRPTRPHSGNL